MALHFNDLRLGFSFYWALCFIDGLYALGIDLSPSAFDETTSGPAYIYLYALRCWHHLALFLLIAKVPLAMRWKPALFVWISWALWPCGCLYGLPPFYLMRLVSILWTPRFSIMARPLHGLHLLFILASVLMWNPAFGWPLQGLLFLINGRAFECYGPAFAIERKIPVRAIWF